MTFADKIALANSQDIGVHAEHCCSIHGCKYGDHDCPVTNYVVKQAYPCEECDAMGEDHYYDHW